MACASLPQVKSDPDESKISHRYGSQLTSDKYMISQLTLTQDPDNITVCLRVVVMKGYIFPVFCHNICKILIQVHCRKEWRSMQTSETK
jgi:hypothetical protein